MTLPTRLSLTLSYVVHLAFKSLSLSYKVDHSDKEALYREVFTVLKTDIGLSEDVLICLLIEHRSTLVKL